jgi:hypothetical protein
MVPAVFLLSLIVLTIWASFQPPPPSHTPTEQEPREAATSKETKARGQQKLEEERYLCRKMAACKETSRFDLNAPPQEVSRPACESRWAKMKRRERRRKRKGLTDDVDTVQNRIAQEPLDGGE